jgi:glycosyltransferase involved in cell wall biosynthesis
MVDRIKVMQLQQKYYVRETDLHEEIVKALPQADFDVTSVYMRDHPKRGELESVSEHVKYFDLSAKQMKGLRTEAKKSLLQYSLAEQFDVMISHRFKPLDLMLKLNQKINIPRCINVVHGFGDFDRFYRRATLRRYLDERWRFVAVSNPVKEYLLDLKCGFNDGNVRVIKNAIDIDKAVAGLLSKAEARSRLGLNPTDYVFGTIGRLVKVKGQTYLLKAFSETLQRLPHAKLVIVGDGGLSDELNEEADQLGLSGKVLMAGHIESAYQLMSAFDVFVLPSLEEGFGLVLLEAMVARLPVIASKVGGVPDVVGESLGTLVEPADVTALAEAMIITSELSEAQRNAEGEQMFQRLLNEYSTADYKQAYRALIDGRAW